MREIALNALHNVSGGLDSTTGAVIVASTLSRAAAYTATASLQGTWTMGGLRPSWLKGWIVPVIADVIFDSDTYRARLPVAVLYGALAGYTDALEQRDEARRPRRA